MFRNTNSVCRNFGFLVDLDFSLSKVAIENNNGEEFSYGQLSVDSSKLFSEFILNIEDENQNIGFLFPPSYDYVAMSFSIWMGNHCAVPISSKSPLQEIEYVLEDSEISSFFYNVEEYGEFIEPLIEKLNGTVEFVPIPRISPGEKSEYEKEYEFIPPNKDDEAIIFYTSGTTGRPKGVVHTYGSFRSQLVTLCDSWKISEDDKCLHVLPLHHVHGVVNALFSTLYAGGKVRFLSPFNPTEVWEAFRNEEISLFHAVPTIYGLLLGNAENQISEDLRDEEYFLKCCENIRLMVSGSAALPTTIFEKWSTLTGHRLLERYGMTEFGMVLGNSYEPIENRIPGMVGFPLGEMEVKIVKEQEDDEGGELWVRGNHLFDRYYGKDEITRESFSDDGEWFMTGDIVEKDDSGNFKILGRLSQDIIKSGGYKISALDIEREICVHENVREVCVLGVPDEIMGEIVVAVLVLKNEEDWSRIEMTKYLKNKLSRYKIPKKFIVISEIQKNQMGKVNKSDLRKLLF